MPPITLPTTAQPVAGDAWLIPTIAAEPGGAFVSAHSLVIRGEEPVIVDTGCSLVRPAWTEQVFSVVEPEDVRWIFLSHDDHDHVGNLDAVLQMCPQATLVGNFAMVTRLAGDVELPLHRMRWLDPGDTLDVGDRTLALLRPPTFDSPATRGLYDPRSRVYWAVDAFGAMIQGEVYDAADVPADLYEQSFATLNSWNTPWLEWVDTARYGEHVRRSAQLDVDVVASAHGPLLRGQMIADAYRRTLDLAAQPAVPQPGQELLDALMDTVFPASA
ncbi:MAG TPA: MBL fold metallo-hydrolase [Pseudonocardia sp.]|nr:MBL fold metallo-hydrolase [Pseudonocardia sp.]